MKMYEMKIQCVSREENVEVQHLLHRLCGARWAVNTDTGAVWDNEYLRFDYLFLTQCNNPEWKYHGHWFFSWGTKDDYDKSSLPAVQSYTLFKEFG